MLRLEYLILLFLWIVFVTSAEDLLQPAEVNAKPASDANDLDADATYYGYARPWRYGWKSGWNGWNGGYRSGWGWSGRGWSGRGGWW